MPNKRTGTLLLGLIPCVSSLDLTHLLKRPPETSTYGKAPLTDLPIVLCSTTFDGQSQWLAVLQCSKTCSSCELRLTPAYGPTPLHCWDKPPSSGQGAVVTWQSPAGARPAMASSSSHPRPAAVGTCWPPSRHLWKGCCLKYTSRPEQSEPQSFVNMDLGF